MPANARRYLLPALAVGLILIQVAIATWRAVHGSSDLLCYHDVSLNWWHTRQYTQVFGVRHYVPGFMVLMALLTAWPMWIVAPLWTLLNIALLLWVIKESSAESGVTFGVELPPVVRWGLPLLLIFPFAADGLNLGQINTIALALSFWAFREEKRGRPIRAGLIIGLGGIVKMYPLIFVLPWLLKRRFRPAVAALTGFAVLAAVLGVVGFGWRGSIEAHRLWFAELRGLGSESSSPAETQTAQNPADGGDTPESLFTERWNKFHRLNNQSLGVVIARFTLPVDEPGRHSRSVQILQLNPRQARHLHALLAGALLAFLAVMSVRNGPAPRFSEWAAWLAAIVAFIPVYWTHYFVLALPAVTLLGIDVFAFRQQGRPARCTTLLLAAWLIGLPLLAWPMARLAGVHCWLTLSLSIYAALVCVRRFTTQSCPPCQS